MVSPEGEGCRRAFGQQKCRNSRAIPQTRDRRYTSNWTTTDESPLNEPQQLVC
jgi:hypothetical protein